MAPNVGTLLSFLLLIASGLGNNKKIIKNLDSGSDVVLRARGDVELGCMYEKGVLSDGENSVPEPQCCYSGNHNNMTVCAEDEYHGDCRSKDTHRVVKEGDAFTGECILIIWNITKKDEGTYLAVFPGGRADNLPIEIKIKKDIYTKVDGIQMAVNSSLLTQCRSQVDSTRLLLETEKPYKWYCLIGGFFAAVFLLLCEQIILEARSRLSDRRYKPVTATATATATGEDEIPRSLPAPNNHFVNANRNKTQDDTTSSGVETTQGLVNDRYESADRYRSVTKWSSAHALQKVARFIVGLFPQRT